MYKMLIVDDEPVTRFGLKDCFHWGDYDIEIVGTADDGKSALHMIGQLNPDIVITDVKMPIMDGITLSNRIRAFNKKIKLIFISGHDDVNYLKSALKLDALDYIFKPIDLEELEVAIEKVVTLLNEEAEKRRFMNKMEVTITESLPLLKGNFLATLVRDGFQDEEALNKRMDFLGIDLPANGLYSLFIISIDDYLLLFDDMSESDKQLTSFSILNICSEILDKHSTGFVFNIQQGEFACLLRHSSKEEEENYFILVREMQDALSSILNISVTVGLAKSVTELNTLPLLYTMARDAIHQKFLLGKKQLIMIDTIEDQDEAFFHLDLKSREKFISIFKTGNAQKLQDFLEVAFIELANLHNIKLKKCQNFCTQLLLISSHLMQELEINQKDLKNHENILWDRLFKLETLDEMKSHLNSYFLRAIEFVHDKQGNNSKSMIKKIKTIIQQDFNKNITIQDIANQVYLTSNYICLIFKENTGLTINEYITKTRIERAKEMLYDNQNKLYDICHAVGYSDPSYFSKLFKKNTGLTPSEYREKAL